MSKPRPCGQSLQVILETSDALKWDDGRITIEGEGVFLLTMNALVSLEELVAQPGLEAKVLAIVVNHGTVEDVRPSPTTLDGWRQFELELWSD